MDEASDLKNLLKVMSPVIVEGEYVFISVSEEKYRGLNIKPLLVFREEEGVTIVIDKSVAEQNDLSYRESWGLIKLQVNLFNNPAVGFLAAITNKLANNGITVYIISAVYHDYLFVPFENAATALKLLKEIME